MESITFTFMNGIAKSINGGLAIDTTGQLPSLTKAQKALLVLIRNCVEQQKPLSVDDMILLYYNNIRKTISIGMDWYYPKDENGNSKYSYGRYARYETKDILECWKAGEEIWRFRTTIRHWFVSNIGILVIKNQLVVVPTIEL